LNVIHVDYDDSGIFTVYHTLRWLKALCIIRNGLIINDGKICSYILSSRSLYSRYLWLWCRWCSVNSIFIDTERAVTSVCVEGARGYWFVFIDNKFYWLILFLSLFSYISVSIGFTILYCSIPTISCPLSQLDSFFFFFPFFKFFLVSSFVGRSFHCRLWYVLLVGTDCYELSSYSLLTGVHNLSHLAGLRRPVM